MKEEATKEPKPKKEALPEWLRPYAKNYPASRVFYTTTDRMVFLDGDRSAALLHQRTIDPAGEVKTYKTK